MTRCLAIVASLALLAPPLLADAPAEPKPGTPKKSDGDRVVLTATAAEQLRKLMKEQPQPTRLPVTAPPASVLDLVKYDAPPGKLAAYLTPDPKDGKKHPAIIWITGGDCNSIDAGCCKDAGALGGQSASEYRKAGMAMMFPSLRG